MRGGWGAWRRVPRGREQEPRAGRRRGEEGSEECLEGRLDGTVAKWTWRREDEDRKTAGC